MTRAERGGEVPHAGEKRLRPRREAESLRLGRRQALRLGGLLEAGADPVRDPQQRRKKAQNAPSLVYGRLQRVTWRRSDFSHAWCIRSTSSGSFEPCSRKGRTVAKIGYTSGIMYRK